MAEAETKKKNQRIKYSFTTISDYFLDEWSQVLGLGATLLYIHLLKYCYKEKNLAWPTLKTLSQKMGVTERSVINYRKILVEYGLIRNIFRRTHASQNNIYQLLKDKELFDTKALPVKMKNIQVQSENISPSKVKKSQLEGENISSDNVKIFHPNNNHLKKNKKTTTSVVDFKKIKDQEEKRETLRERMKALDFSESFTEKVFKEYPLGKIEEKLALYAKGRQVRNPVGFLLAALKEDYGDDVKCHVEEKSPARLKMASRLHGNGTGENGNEDKKTLSREEAIKRIQAIREEISR